MSLQHAASGGRAAPWWRILPSRSSTPLFCSCRHYRRRASLSASRFEPGSLSAALHPRRIAFAPASSSTFLWRVVRSQRPFRFVRCASSAPSPSLSPSTKATPPQDMFYAHGTSFDQLHHLHPSLLRVLHRQNKIIPSHIQSLAIPVLLSGKDAVIAAETGSGKTLAYALPILSRLLRLSEEQKREGQQKAKRKTFPEAVFVVANKQLLEQLNNMLEPFLQEAGLRHLCLSGLQTFPAFAEEEGESRVRVLLTTPICLQHNLKLFPARPSDALSLKQRLRRQYNKAVAKKTQQKGDNKHMQKQTSKEERDGTDEAEAEESMVGAIQYLVLDEADQVFYSGGTNSAIQDVLHILTRDAAIRRRRHRELLRRDSINNKFVLVGATFPDVGQRSLQKYVKQVLPRAQWVKTEQLHKLNPNLHQRFIRLKVGGRNYDGVAADETTTEQKDRLSGLERGSTQEDSRLCQLLQFCGRSLHLPPTTLYARCHISQQHPPIQSYGEPSRLFVALFFLLIILFFIWKRRGRKQ